MIRVALAVVIRQGRVLLARRRAGGHLPGMWEFPGGKVRPGEEPSLAALRELEEETGLVGERAETLLTVPYAYPDREVLLEVFQVTEGGRAPAGRSQSPGRGLSEELADDPANRLRPGEARPLECEEVAWLRPDEIREEAMPPANAPILQYLRSLA